MPFALAGCSKTYWQAAQKVLRGEAIQRNEAYDFF
jgi:hypothetical protein